MFSKVLVVALAALVGVAAPAPAPADARATRDCRSGDLRYPFEPGGPRTFGVFRLQATGTDCVTAHRVAERWMDRFESSLRAGRVGLPASVGGFAFAELAPNAPQTYRLRGRRGAASVRFDYVVPNG